MKHLLIVAALAGCAMPALAQPASDGALFGVRENVQNIDISPDGSHVVYMTPGPGRSSVAIVADLAGGPPHPVLQSDGDPEQLRWCNFASNHRLVCQFVGVSQRDGDLVSFSRLIAIDIDGKNGIPLGQGRSYYDAGIRQNDGNILDWLPDEDGAILMARDYVPEEGKTNTRIVRTADGLGIDRIDVTTMKVT